MSKTTYSMKELGQLADPSFTQVWVMPEVETRKREAERQSREATRQRVITANARASQLSASAGLAFTRSSRNVFGRPKPTPSSAAGTTRSNASGASGAGLSGVSGMWAAGWARNADASSRKGPSPKTKRRAGSRRPLTPTWRLPTSPSRAEAAKASMLPGRRGRRGSMSVRLRKTPTAQGTGKASSTRHLSTPASDASGGDDKWWKRAIVRPAPVLSTVGTRKQPHAEEAESVTLDDLKRLHIRDWGQYKLNSTRANAKYPRRLRSPFMKERRASAAGPLHVHTGTNRLAEDDFTWDRPSSAPVAAVARSPEAATMNKIRSIQLASMGRYDDDPELGFEGGVRVRPPSAPETGRRSTGPPAQPVKPKELLATSSSASLHMMLNGKHRSRSFNRLAVDMDPSGVAGSADSSHMMVGVAADVEHPSVDDEDAPDLDTIDFRGGTGDTSSESEDECLEMLDSGRVPVAIEDTAWADAGALKSIIEGENFEGVEKYVGVKAVPAMYEAHKGHLKAEVQGALDPKVLSAMRAQSTTPSGGGGGDVGWTTYRQVQQKVPIPRLHFDDPDLFEAKGSRTGYRTWQGRASSVGTTVTYDSLASYATSSDDEVSHSGDGTKRTYNISRRPGSAASGVRRLSRRSGQTKAAAYFNTALELEEAGARGTGRAPSGLPPRPGSSQSTRSQVQPRRRASHASTASGVTWGAVAVPEDRAETDSVGSGSVVDPDDLYDPRMYTTGFVTSNSPRAGFLRECHARGITVVEPLILRKIETPTINLAHFGIGKARGVAIAPALARLPYLQHLNLSNNRLDDEVLRLLFNALAERRTPLITVNVARNVIGKGAATALKAFLEACNTLIELDVSRCQITDARCQVICRAAPYALSLKGFHMDHNCVTAASGDALGSFVRNCPQLRTLSLAWNKLGHHGATQVVQPMVDSTGAGIRDLDLSWNNLQNAGAQAVGDVVRASTCLLNLNMAHNGVGSTGSIVLAAGLQSSTVHVLNMAGNPVGKGGARALLRCVGMDSGCRDIDLSGCAMEADDSFDPSKPAGTYNLDLAQAYDRCVAMELIRLVHDLPDIQWTRAKYTPPRGRAQPMTIVRSYEHVPRGKALWTLLRENLSDLLDYMSDLNDKTKPPRPDTGVVGLGRKATDRGDVTSSHVALGDGGDEWVLPREGTLAVTVVYEPKAPKPGNNKSRERGMLGILHLIKSKQLEARDKLKMMQVATDDLYFMPHEAQNILRTDLVASSGRSERIRTVARLLFRLINPAGAPALIERNLNHRERKELQAFLGPAYRMVLGNPTGHYKLDMRNERQREVLKRLVEHNNHAKQRMRDRFPGLDPSCSGTRDGFRNATKQVLSRKPFVMRGDRMGAMLQEGVYEFDFVSYDRPSTRARAVTSHTFRRLMRIVGVQELSERAEMETDELRSKMERREKEEEELRRRTGRQPRRGSVESLRSATGGRRSSVASVRSRRGSIVSRAGGRRGSTVSRAGGRRGSMASRTPTEWVDRDEEPWVGPPEFLSACARTENPNPLPRYVQCAACLPKLSAAELKRRQGRLRRLSMQIGLPSPSNADAKQEEKEDGQPATPSATSSDAQADIKWHGEGGVSAAPITVHDKGLEQSLANGGGGAGAANLLQAGLSAALQVAEADEGEDPFLTGHDEEMGGEGKDVRKPFLDKSKFPEIFRPDPLEFFPPLHEDTVRLAADVITDMVHVCSLKYFTARQVERVVRLLPRALPTVRIEAVIILFSRIVDLRNVERVLWALSMPERMAVVSRLGIMALWNPMRPDGAYHIDLSLHDEHTLARNLVHLAVVEPGENWEDEAYDDKYGWELPSTWVKSVPTRGKLVTTYTSTSQGCQPKFGARHLLKRTVLTWT